MSPDDFAMCPTFASSLDPPTLRQGRWMAHARPLAQHQALPRATECLCATIEGLRSLPTHAVLRLFGMESEQEERSADLQYVVQYRGRHGGTDKGCREAAVHSPGDLVYTACDRTLGNSTGNLGKDLLHIAKSWVELHRSSYAELPGAAVEDFETPT